MSHPKGSILCALLLSLILVSASLNGVEAASVEAMYGGAGVWPAQASANSERYFRCQVSWNPSSEFMRTVRVSCSAGTYYGMQNGVNLGTDDGVAVRTVSSSSSSRVVEYTFGPFAGYDIWGWPHQGVFGNLSTPGDPVSSSADTCSFYCYWVTSSSSGSDQTDSLPVVTVNDNQDYLQWYSGEAAGVDPISVQPAEITPDDGTGSSRFRFRVRYARRGSANLPPRTERHDGYPPGGSSSSTFVEYDYDTDSFRLAGDRHSDHWTYGQFDDWHSQDKIGWTANWGGQEPGVILIIDGDLSRPRFMYQEDPSDTNYNDGAIFFYDLLPTDYKRYLENIFMFPYDPGGDDELDYAFGYMRGRPFSNNYVALSCGGHTYEFLASDDFSPPNGHNGWFQVGRPGYRLSNDYIRTRPLWRWGDRHFQISSVEVNDVTTAVHDAYSGSAPAPANVRYEDHDGAAGGSGYPYDSQDLGQYPKVDPVLSAHPYFPTGTIYPGSDFTPDPLDASGIRTVSPFTVETGAGPNPPLRYTNDDTILPNYVNIQVGTALTPFRGGKWTNQTTFTFRINYWQSDNKPPQLIRVFIRRNDAGGEPGAWQAYTMEQRDPLETSYTDGCVFQFQATPEQFPGGGGVGDYNYYFAASDGTRTTTYPNRPGVYAQPGNGNIYDPGHDGFNTTLGQYGVPTTAAGEDYYWFRVNRRPTLSGQSVDPAAGRAGENYHFRVDYTDIDGEVLNPDATGDRPFRAKLHLDLFGGPLGQASVSQVTGSNSLRYTTQSGNLYDDGALYSAEVPFTIRMQTGAAAGNTYTITGNTGDTITLGAGANLSADGVSSGDQFRIAQWFEGTMLPADATDNNYSDGAEYVFDTATNVELGPGVHRYWFEFTDDWGSWLFPNDANVKVEGESVRYPTAGYFEGPEVRENSAPELVDFRFTPQSTVAGQPDGTTATSFVFFVTYVDYENDPPALIRLGIDGTAQNPAMILDMVADPPEDTVYTDGATYKTPAVKLAEGDHVFYAQASDGKARFPETAPGDPLIFSGPWDDANGNGQHDADEDYEPSVKGPTVAPNTPPVLSFLPDDDGSAPDNPPGLEPNSGRRETSFTYRVVYSDADRFAGIAGNPPRYVRVYIDDVAHEMTQVDPGDRDYTDGATFEFTISNLIEGTPHTYFFLASDDLDRARLPNTGVVPSRYDGPVVDEPPAAPPNLLVQDTPNDNGSSINIEFSASRDDGGGADDVTEYRVYRTEIEGQYSDVPVLRIPATDAPAYSAQDAPAFSEDPPGPPTTGVPYYYIVKAYDAVAESDRSNEEGPVTPKDNIAPQPPSGVTVTDPQVGGTLDISWTPSPDDGGGQNDVIEYHIYRATGPTLFAPPYIGTVAAGGTSFRDTTVTDETDVYYMVKAYDGANESSASNVDGPKQSTDGQPPVISELQPAAGATGVRRDTTISFVAEDNGAGVDQGSVQMEVTVSGAAVDGFLQVGGTAARTTVEFTPDTAFGYLRNVRVEVSVEDLQGNASAPRSWSFITEGEPTSTISGRVVEKAEAGGGPIADVEIIVGELHGTTGADGNYTITGVADGTYLVRAERRGWYFAPEQIQVTVPGDQSDVNFTGEPGYDIAGRVVDEDGAGKPGVLIGVDGRSQVTDAQGDYRFQDLPAGSYTVVPTLDGFDFNPPERDVELGPAATEVDFEATVEQHVLSGMIQTSSGTPMEQVAVTARNTATGVTVEVETGSDELAGEYIFQLTQGTYEVTPARTGYQFKPLKQTVELMTQKTNVNFLGVPLYEMRLYGGLSLVAVPINPEAGETFQDAFGANTPVARYDTVNEQWITNQTPAHPLLNLGAGRGYFVKPDIPRDQFITNYVAGTPIPTSVGYDLYLEKGWTMVGNPYQAELAWAKLGIAGGGAVKDYGFIWDRNVQDYRVVADVVGFGILNTLDEGAGFWMHSTSVRTVRINAPATAAVQTETGAALGDGDYLIPVQAAGAGRADTCAAAGVVQAAASLPGGGRLVNPPAAGSQVDLYFIGSDGSKLCYDLRASTAATETWDFEVVTDIGDIAVAVSLPDLSRVPADKQVTLVDTASGKRVYARTTQQYTYQATRGQARRFKLEVGPRSVGSLAISAVSAAMSRGGQVTLTYALSQPASVSISVMNISGRRVKHLSADKAATSGVNTEVWDLTSARGTVVPAGRYLISIEANTDSGQATRALVPVQVSR